MDVRIARLDQARAQVAETSTTSQPMHDAVRTILPTLASSRLSSTARIRQLGLRRTISVSMSNVTSGIVPNARAPRELSIPTEGNNTGVPWPCHGREHRLRGVGHVR